MGKKTLIIGATPDSSRYAFKAARMLQQYGNEVELVGKKKGEIFGKIIHNDQPRLEGIDTVTLYVGSNNQTDLVDYVISLRPKRIIFNPGTENEDFLHLAIKHNIEPVIGCTLVMLATNTY